jgi:hypothetical protein
MASDLRNASEPSLASLVGGIIGDAQQLTKQEVALARREISDELTKTKQAAITLGIGLGVAILGMLLLAFMGVYLLNELAGLPHRASFLIVGGASLIVGILLVFVGKVRADQIHVVPQQTTETMRVQWLKNQT